MPKERSSLLLWGRQTPHWDTGFCLWVEPASSLIDRLSLLSFFLGHNTFADLIIYTRLRDVKCKLCKFHILIDASFCLRFWFKFYRIYWQKSKEWRKLGCNYPLKHLVFLPETFSFHLVSLSSPNTVSPKA